jgi:hypothetical protein
VPAAPTTAVGIFPAGKCRVFGLRAGAEAIRAADVAATLEWVRARRADRAARAILVPIVVEILAAAAAALAVGGTRVPAVKAAPAGGAYGRAAAAAGAIRVAELAANGRVAHACAIGADPAATQVQPGDVVFVEAEGAFGDAVGTLEEVARTGACPLHILITVDAEPGAAVDVALAGLAQTCPCTNTRASPGAIARLQIESLAFDARRAAPVAALALVAIGAA